MEYAAFLRGVNISGKNRVPMGELKTLLEEAGYGSVKTYLNSGNVTFVHEPRNVDELAADISRLIADRFQLHIPVFAITVQDLQEILAHRPEWWGTGKDFYHNLIFMMSPCNWEPLIDAVGEPDGCLDKAECCGNAVFWSFDREKYRKSRWWSKTAGPEIRDMLTIRTAATIEKLLSGK